MVIDQQENVHLPYLQAFCFILWVSSRQGANVGLAGADVHVLERTGTKVSVTVIDDHELSGLDIVTCVALVHTYHGKINMIMHEYAYYDRGNTIHSPCQIEWFHNT